MPPHGITGYKLKRWLKFQNFNTAKALDSDKSVLAITKWARALVARRKASKKAVTCWIRPFVCDP